MLRGVGKTAQTMTFLLLCLALILAACADEDDGTAADEDDGTAADEDDGTAADEDDGDAELDPTGDPIAFATGIDPSFSQLYIADELGYWDDRGLDVTVETFSSGGEAGRAMLAGDVDAFVGGSMGVVSALAQGGQAMIVGSTRPGLDGFAAAVSVDDIAEPEDLEGRTVGMAEGSPSSQLFYNLYVDTHGIDGDEVNTVFLQPQEMIIAFEQGDIDALFVWSPWFNEAVESRDDAHILALDRDDGVYAANLGIAATPEMANERGDQLTVLLEGLVEADQYLADNPDESAQLVADYLDLEVDEVAEILETVVLYVEYSEATLSDLCQGLNFLLDQGEVQNTPEWADFLRPQFLEAAAPDRVTTTDLPDC